MTTTVNALSDTSRRLEGECRQPILSPILADRKRALLTSPVKSYGISLVIHLAVLASLNAIHTSTTQHFFSAGQSQVISIEASKSTSTLLAESASVLFPPTPVSASPGSPLDRRLSLEELEVGESLDVDVLPKLDRLDLPPPPQPSSKLSIVAQATMARRPPAAQIPEVSVRQEPKRSRVVRRDSEPPVIATSPVQQTTGFKESEPADLADNPPPAFPAEAIRNRWEGVVMLRLRIAKSGKVEKVEVIGSSGHPLLDQAAVKAVSRWRGKPALRWGQAIESVETLPIRFRL